MTCEDIAGFLGQYIEDDLPDEGRLRIETHLFTCRNCTWEAETLRLTRRRLQNERGETITSDAFRARVLNRLRADNPHLSPSEDSEKLQRQLPILF